MSHSGGRKRFVPPSASIQVPDPMKDFRTYERVSASLGGVGKVFEAWRRNQGAVGYAMLNGVSDVTKAMIAATMRGEYGDADELQRSLEISMAEFSAQQLPEDEAGLLPESYRGALAESVGAGFSRDLGQEYVEAALFRLMWPVVTGFEDEMPELPTLKRFGVAPQSVLAGYVDVVSEMGKAVIEERFAIENDVSRELVIMHRFILITASIDLRLSQERHTPGNVINNSYGRWNAFTNVLRTRVQGTIANIKRDYVNLRGMYHMTDRSTSWFEQQK